MSRRKQSRPQHFENDVKDMPGADVAVTEDKLILAVNSVNPEIKSEEKDKVNDLDMTQGGPPGGGGIFESVPPPSDADIDTATEKMATHCNSKNDAKQRSNSPEDGESCMITSKFLGAHQNSSRQRMPQNCSNLPLPRGKSGKKQEENESSTSKPKGFVSDSSLVRPENGTTNEKSKNEASLVTEKLQIKSHRQQHTLPVFAGMPVGRKYECEKCGVSFHGRETYEVHVKHYCSGKKQGIACQVCGAKFDSKMRLMMHMNVHIPQNMCLLCSERMRDIDCEKHVIFHVDDAEKKNDGTICCPACESSFMDKSALLSHFRVHHTIHENTMPLLSAPVLSGPAYPPKTLENVGGQIKGDSGCPADKNKELASSPINFNESGLQSISSKRKTSTPFRPPLSVEADTSKMSAFSCIVCGLGFPDVIALQRHLLTAHTAISGKPISPPDASNEENGHRSKPDRPSLRKVSTVSPPQLSLLAAPMSGRTDELSKDAAMDHLPKMTKGKTSLSTPYSKKRKERIITESDREDYALMKQNTLKRVRRDTEYAPPRENDGERVEDAVTGIRRVSCPVVSTRDAEPKDLENPNSTLRCQPEMERYCVQCDIKFSSTGNFRAHKQFYCASRHVQKLRPGYQSDQFDDQEYQNDCANEHEELYLKSRKRNVGNKSSMTPRKRSHLTPLETIRGTSPVEEDSGATRPTSIRKSCPSHFGAVDVSARTTPTDNPPPASAPKLPKKHLCQECNIWFSKYDTYIAHKKYYCESRRKDRGGVRTVQSSTRNHPKRRSETTSREPLFQSDNSLSIPDRSGWSSRGSSPSTEAEDERQASRKNAECGNNFQSSINSYRAQFPFYGQVDQEMLARLSLMQPLILNQYIAMLRERMGQGMQSNGILFQTSPFVGLPSIGNDFPVTRVRKLSADETHFLGTSDEDRQNGIRRNNRPNRQSCVAVINVKREIDKSDEESVSATPLTKLAPDRNGPSPLDLSNKVSKEPTATGDRPVSEGPAISRESPFPTIDLRTTVFPIIKREPEIELPVDNTQGPVSTESKKGLETNEVVASSAAASINNQQENQAPQVKHCKNCDARFTSLSTFIAHKKYYCTAASSGGLVRNDVKHVQLAH